MSNTAPAPVGAAPVGAAPVGAAPVGAAPVGAADFDAAGHLRKSFANLSDPRLATGAADQPATRAEMETFLAGMKRVEAQRRFQNDLTSLVAKPFSIGGVSLDWGGAEGLDRFVGGLRQRLAQPLTAKDLAVLHHYERAIEMAREGGAKDFERSLKSPGDQMALGASQADQKVVLPPKKPDQSVASPRGVPSVQDILRAEVPEWMSRVESGTASPFDTYQDAMKAR